MTGFEGSPGSALRKLQSSVRGLMMMVTMLPLLLHPTPSQVSIVCSWVKACAATQAKCKIKGDQEFKDIRPGGPASCLGPLLFGSLPTAALFFYWLNVTALLLPILVWLAYPLLLPVTDWLASLFLLPYLFWLTPLISCCLTRPGYGERGAFASVKAL